MPGGSRPVRRIGNKIDLGRILGAIYSAGQVEEPNPYYGQLPGDLPYDLPIDAAVVVDQPWRDKGQGAILNRRALINQNAIGQETTGRIEALRAKAAIDAQAQREKELNYYLGQVIGDQQIPPYLDIEKGAEFRAKNDLVPGQPLEPFAQPTANRFMNRQLTQAATDQNLLDEALATRPLIPARTQATIGSEIEVANKDKALANIINQAITADPQRFIDNELRKATAPPISLSPGERYLDTYGGISYDNPPIMNEETIVNKPIMDRKGNVIVTMPDTIRRQTQGQLKTGPLPATTGATTKDDGLIILEKETPAPFEITINGKTYKKGDMLPIGTQLRRKAAAK